MKKQFNLQLEEHLDVLQEVAFQSLSGIKVSEVIEIRKRFYQNINEYAEFIQILYFSQLNFLNLLYELNEEVERALFGYIDYVIREIAVENLDSSDTLSFS